jgi:hypothetical protein
MDAWVWIVIAVVAVIVIAVVAYALARKRRHEELREQFGPEYDRAIGEAGDVRGGESELQARRERREQLNIRPLDADAAKEYGRRWDETQRRFVDDPEGALAEADGLIVRVMRDRGYPMDDFDQRSADISVDHPDVVEHYRSAHDISTRAKDDDRQVSTEDMRQGLVHYRELFARLLGPDERRVASA